MAVLSHHLLALVRDTGANGGRQFQSGEDLLIIAVDGSSFGDGVVLWDGLLEDDLQGFPDEPAQISEKFPVV